MKSEAFLFDGTSPATQPGGEVKERPILFSAPMVRALLAGTKTQTRRALRVQPDSHHWESLPGYELKRSKIVTIKDRCAVKFSHSIPQNREWDTALDWLLCPYGQPGDRLWVRESFADLFGTGIEHRDSENKLRRYAFAADTKPGSYADDCRKDYGVRWTPSIHMPRAASRILLEVTEVRVERLQDISEEDAMAEGLWPAPGEWWSGAKGQASPTKAGAYALLWESINGPGSWDANPWVWAVSFKVLPIAGPSTQSDPK